MSDVKKQREMEDKMRAIAALPLVVTILKDQADVVVTRALRLPILQWMADAQEVKVSGVVWFRYEGVFGDTLKQAFDNSAEFQTMLTKHKFAVRVPARGGLVLLHRLGVDGQFNDSDFVPVIRAMLTPY